MKLTIKESFEGERSKPETIFSVRAKIYEELFKKLHEMNSIMYLCEDEHSPNEFFCFVPKYEGKSFEKLAGKSDVKFNLELSEFLNWT